MILKKNVIQLALLLLSTATMAQKQNITLEHLFAHRTFAGKSVHGLRSMNDGEHYTTIAQNALVKYSYKTGEAVDTLVKISDFNNEEITELWNYQFSTDEQRIIFYINPRYVYRHSFIANYYVWDFQEKKLYSVSPQGGERLATISPDGSKVAFIRNNNLFISDLAGNMTTITSDGSDNHIINGAPDWVYEEEFGYSQAFEWSPTGDKIAWCRYDESHVKEFNMQRFKGLAPEYTQNALYPEDYRFKYPKAGEDNSVLSVHVYDIKTAGTITLDTGIETNIYIPRIYWTKQTNTVAILRLNRLQNHLELLYADATTGQSQTVYSDKNQYYIEASAYKNIIFIDTNQFLIMSEADGYNHIYLYNTKNATLQQITTGQHDVISLIDYNPKTKILYYTSTEEGAIYRTVYSITLTGKNKTKLSQRLGTNSMTFSKNFSYNIGYHTSAKTPLHITLNNSKGEQIRVLEDNSELADTISKYNIAEKQFFTFNTTEGTKLNGWIIKPIDFDTTQKYPVVMTQYSGPNSQSVTDTWEIGWEQVLAAEGFVVACVDGRGTGGRGERFRKITYKELGKYETIDQIETARYLGTLPYINPDKIAIWGWSYGGFMALNCITQGADHFAAAIAVAPVTSWIYYDNIYTERYMRTPQENPEGYNNNSPISHVDKLKGKLLIIHGSFDDNVHAQNTYEFTEALVQAGKQFDMMLYNNRNHSIYGGNTRMHLYTKMKDFFINNLK